MNSSGHIGITTMKPYCRVLTSCRNSSIFKFPSSKSNHFIADNSSKFQSQSAHGRRFQSCSVQILGKKCGAHSNRRAFSLSDPSWSQIRVYRSCSGVRGGRRGVLVISNVGSDFRKHSTSVESHVNEKGFESIYINGGLNVKPLVIERIERGHLEEESILEFKEPEVNFDHSEGLNERKVEREVPEIEKEAWRLLRSAVVDYYGHPVGTVAANDPGDKQPLNYDQVFIRDFVPSALAFLLKGEGEIVKNFLLHTLQLQVSCGFGLMLILLFVSRLCLSEFLLTAHNFIIFVYNNKGIIRHL